MSDNVSQQLGDTVKINGKQVFSYFNAELKSSKWIPGSVEVDFSRAVGKSSMLVNKQGVTTGSLILVFYVNGSTQQNCDINTSYLVAECRKCIIEINESNSQFEYDAVLTNVGSTRTGVQYYNEVELEFSAVKRLPIVTHTYTNGSATFTNQGDIASGMILKVTSPTSLESVTVAGIVITDLEENSEFIIDGIVGEVKCRGENRFLDTNLVSFPKVQPGENTITFDQGVSVEISYYPTFLV